MSNSLELCKAIAGLNEERDRLKKVNAELLEVCEAIAKLNEGQGRLNMCSVAGWARQVIAKTKEAPVLTLEAYELNEENNYHTENYLLLARRFGSEEEIDLCERAVAENERLGCAGPLSRECYDKVNHYYKLLKKHDAKKEVPA